MYIAHTNVCTSCRTNSHILFKNRVSTAAEITVGFDATTYDTSENETTVEVCASLLSGNITGLSFEVEFSAFSGSALGGKFMQLWHEWAVYFSVCILKAAW